MQKIIILTISIANDGAGRVLSELSAEWVKRGCKVTIIQTGADNYGVHYSLPDGIEIINIRPVTKVKLIRYIYDIKQIVSILKKNPDAIVVAFIVASIFISGIASLFVKNRIVVSERNNPRECPSGKIQRKLRDWAFCRANCCVFQTDDAKRMFPRRVQLKGVIIPNPINGNLPIPYCEKRRKVIVAVGRLHPQKNFSMLLEAFSWFHRNHQEYSLEIYGQGNERETLEQLAIRLEIDSFVVMPGYTNNVYEKMRDAAMYVSSSDYEGISNSMLEALGMGVPTIVTDCPVGGAKMIIRNNINGILVPVGDTDALCSAMKKIANDERFAKSLSEEAAKIREDYKLEVIADKWLEVI